MPQYRIDLGAFRGSLPYASEIFGVYQPLLGWKSGRIQHRVDSGRDQRLSDLVGRYTGLLQPAYKADFAPLDRFVMITDLDAAQPSGVTSFGGILMRELATRLPPRETMKPELWDHFLANDRIRETLSEVVAPAVVDRYRAMAQPDPAGGRMTSGPSPEDAVRTMLATESRAAGVLAMLRDRRQHGILDQVFYGKSDSSQVLMDAIATQGDPFATIDPSKELDRVGLSPVGLAHLFRQYFFELDTFLGTPTGHVWLSPGSMVELIEVHTRRLYVEQSTEQLVESIRKTEKGTTLEDELSDAVKTDNRSNLKFGVSATANQKWGWGSATESASFGLETTQERAREQAHKTKRAQSEKLSSEIKQSFKSTFRTVTETTDQSTKRYVLNNTTEQLVNYELRRKMRQVAVQVQDIGSYLCWQTYVDDPGRPLGLGQLVHIGAPPDLSKIPAPEMIVPPQAFSQEVSVTIPFIDLDDASDGDTFINGSEADVGAVFDETNHIVADFKQGPVRCEQPNFRLSSVAVAPQGGDATLSAPADQIVEADPGSYTYVIHLDKVNFKGAPNFQAAVTLHWEPEVDTAAIDAENKKRLSQFSAKERDAYRASFLEAARQRIRLASNVQPRKFEDLREEERVVVYRALIQDLLTPSAHVPQPDRQTQHIVAELLDSIFDVDKMLYFVAPEWWRPRLHHAHQQLGGIETTTDPMTGEAIAVSSSVGPAQIVNWGEGTGREDNYYITEDSAPARLGSSLGWLLQLDGDDLRNAFLNAPWVKAVMPIRPGREKAALNWLKHVEGMNTIGESDLYVGPEPDWQGKTIFEVLDILAQRVADKHAASITTMDFPDPIDDANTVRATPVDRVFEHGFDPLAGGFRVQNPGDFEVFDQWIEVLPTDQVVAVEVLYDAKTGRQV